MAAMQLIADYRDHAQYRASLNRLADLVFNFNLEEWRRKGFWNNRYVPYSYVDGDEVVANVSVNLMDLIVEGKARKAVQIGTVMTHPAYRGRGLSAALMDMVLKKYERDYDFIYLFANRDALDFYPRFGFNPLRESGFTAAAPDAGIKHKRPPEKLDLAEPHTLNRIYNIIKARAPVSQVFGATGAHDLAMFHCIYAFGDGLYYLEEDEVLAICRAEGHTLHLYDLIWAKKFDTRKVFGGIAGEEIKEIVFYFTPDLLGLDTHCAPLESDDIFFIKGEPFQSGRKDFRYPVTAQA
jgi:predicted GNAT family N-acyltransferase